MNRRLSVVVPVPGWRFSVQKCGMMTFGERHADIAITILFYTDARKRR
jgi:hypothetical protein